MNTIGHIKTERISVDLLKPADYNPREISDKAKKGLSKAIDEFGFIQPIVWNKQTGNIVGGHQRLNDIIAKGAKETDVIIVEWTLEKEKAANIALNHHGITGTFNQDKLQLLLGSIEEDFKLELNFEELELSIGESYGKANKEIDLDDVSDDMTLSFKFSSDQYRQVIDVLRTYNESKEIALITALGL